MSVALYRENLRNSKGQRLFVENFYQLPQKQTVPFGDFMVPMKLQQRWVQHKTVQLTWDSMATCKHWNVKTGGLPGRIFIFGRYLDILDIWEIFHSVRYFYNKTCSQIKCSLWCFRFCFQPEFLAMVSEKHEVWVKFSAKLSWLWKKLKSSKTNNNKKQSRSFNRFGRTSH